MSLRGKIILMLVMALAALAVVSAGNYYFNVTLRETVHLQTDIDTALRELLAARVAETRFLSQGDAELAQRALKLMDQARDRLEGQRKEATGEVAATVGQLTGDLAAYRTQFGTVVEQVKRINKLRAEMLASGANLARIASEDIVGFMDLKESEMFMETGEGLDDTHSNFRAAVKDYRYFMDQVILNSQRLYLNADQKTYENRLKDILANLKMQADNVGTFMPNIKLEETVKAWDELLKQAKVVLKADNELFKLWQANRQAMAGLEKLSAQLTDKADDLLATTKQEMVSIEHTSQLLGLVVFLVAGAGLAVWGLLTVRNILRSLGGAVSSLNQVAGQVSDAAGHFNASSTDLASGASQQAASLEETSASLEELTSMTKTSAEHAREVDELMGDTTRVVAKAGQAMGGLRDAMAKITTNSDQTAHIIKTIDEIAFQTNLLALNAAVEAARAGEAGAGFAVVADEVRNLAMRAAEAAKNTSDLIEQNIGDVKRGDELAESTAESFAQVEEGAQSVGGLVSQIASAAQEQAQGIDQISRAASEMDKVTQRVAGSAEETSAASEELGSYSAALGEVVTQLNGLLGGSVRRRLGKQKKNKAEKDETLLLPAE